MIDLISFFYRNRVNTVQGPSVDGRTDDRDQTVLLIFL